MTKESRGTVMPDVFPINKGVEPITVNTLEGHEITVKKMTWRKRILGLNVMARIFEAIKDSLSNDDIHGLINKIMVDCPDMISEIVSISIEKDKDWVMDNFDFDEVLKVASPFLQSLIKTRDGIVSAIIPEMSKKTSQDS